MSSYKVPQNVEADDKLLGPFSFRQFVYLLVATVGIGLAYFLFRILPPLVVIPVPVILFFLALALPLRKDQPMEIYLAAILSYYLKPRKRMWDPDGIESLVQIAAPRTQEPQRVKNVSVSEAEQRLRYLSDLSDSRGWSVRGVNAPQGSSMNPDMFNEAQQLPDTLDDNATISQNLDYMISQSNQRRHDEMLNRFQQSAATPTQTGPDLASGGSLTPPPLPGPYATLTPTQQPSPQSVEPSVFDQAPSPQYNPYPTSMNQSVIQPLSEQPAPQPQAQPQPQPQLVAQPAPAPSSPAEYTEPAPQPIPEPTEPEPDTSAKVVSPDIIKLANNADLSIETIAREANRINKKEEDENEVVISLR